MNAECGVRNAEFDMKQIIPNSEREIYTYRRQGFQISDCRFGRNVPRRACPVRTGWPGSFTLGRGNSFAFTKKRLYTGSGLQERQLQYSEMKKEYDFAEGERGKFYRPNLRLNLPIYLEEDIADFIQKYARRKKTDAQTVVNRILRSNKELIQLIR